MNEKSLVLNPNIFDPIIIDKVFSNLDVSEKTKKDYLARINRFLDFVKSTSFDRNSLLEYKRNLSNDSTIKVSTKNKFLIVAKLFVQQLYRIGILSVDISTGVKTFKLSSQSFKTNGFTDFEVSQILKGLSQSTDLRLQSILSLKLFGGLRDIELTRLMVEDINLEEGFIMVHGKSRDSKESLPIVPQVVTVLKNYLSSTGKRSGSLFSDKRNKKGKPLTTKTVWMVVREFLNNLGIHRNPHQCRSFFCTELVRGMDNLFDVINYTRHASIQTLQSYVNQINRNQTIPKFKSVFKGFSVGSETVFVSCNGERETVSS